MNLQPIHTHVLPEQVLFGVATLLCVRTIFNNILESVGLIRDGHWDFVYGRTYGFAHLWIWIRMRVLRFSPSE